MATLDERTISSSSSNTTTTMDSTTTTATSVAPLASYESRFTEAPPVETPYTQKMALADLPGVHYALELFLSSQMLESEEYCHLADPKKERLYPTMGYGLIQCVKGLMSYEDEDLLSGIKDTKKAIEIATLHRKKTYSFTTRLAGYVTGTTSSGGVAAVKAMTPVERHAELVYAESLFEKALLGIIYSGDWLAFIKEALSMRTTVSIYRSLDAFVESADAAAKEQGLEQDPELDVNFRSGVLLGIGASHLVLTMIPSKLATLVELFGYKGDRELGLKALAEAGGWDRDKEEPSVSASEEGTRRSVCDMALLIFHLVLSGFTFDGVDITMAQRILDWNLKRYPKGVFFLFGAGRLSIVRSQPSLAIEYYTRAMESQIQYRNLHHISFWEIALARLALWEVEGSLKHWREMRAEANWSKAIYAYGVAACLLQIGAGEKEKEEATKLMKEVPDLKQRIAGKSIPLEKFVARKARKYLTQQNRLLLPALEIAYIFASISHAPRAVITGKMLPVIKETLAHLKKYEGGKEKEYEGGHGYWDDLALAKFLEGVCMRYVAYPDPDALVDLAEKIAIPKAEAEKKAKEAFEAVFKEGARIEYDHYLIYYSHYELGRLYTMQGKQTDARTQLELVYSGKALDGDTNRKSKYSLENSLHMRTAAALESLKASSSS